MRTLATKPFWNGQLVAVAVEQLERMEFGDPVRLFELPTFEDRNRFAPAADGRRFLVNVPVESVAEVTSTVVVHLRSELERRVPASN